MGVEGGDGEGPEEVSALDYLLLLSIYLRVFMGCGKVLLCVYDIDQ